MRERSCGILKRDVDIIVNNIGDLIRNTRAAKIYLWHSLQICLI